MVFGLSILLISVLSQQVHGESVVGSIQTRVSYTANGKTVAFVTRENTLSNALVGQGINLAKNDITDPPLTTSLIGSDLSAKLVSASPVLIDDNGQSWVGMSAYSTAPEILKQLKIEVDKADHVSVGLILNPDVEGMAGQKITIQRAPVYTVTVDGTQVVIHSWAKTVLAVLTDGGVVLNVNDTADPVRDALAPASGQIEVTRVNYTDFEETVSIAFTRVSQTSYEMYKGQSEVTQQGINGSKKQSVHVVYHNGVEVSRDITSSEILSDSQAQITLVGAKPYGIDDLWPILVAAGSKYGVDPAAMARVMFCESGGHVESGAGSAHQGLFQWDGGFYNWAAKAGFPSANIFDPNAQIYATALRVSQNGWSAWGCKP